LNGDRRFEVRAWSGIRTGSLLDVPLCPVDLTNADQTVAAFADARPDLVVHAAAICRIDACFADPELAERVNVGGTRLLCELASRHRARLVYVSTDLVFNGERGSYREADRAVPLSRYGSSKLRGEQPVLEATGNAVARVSLLFGPSLNGRPSFFDQQCTALREGRALKLFEDEWRTPLSLATAASALIELAVSPYCGTLHLGGPERMSRWEMGQRLARTLGCDPSPVVRCRQTDVQVPEPRPQDVSLDSSCWRALFPQHPWPTWEDAVRELGLGADRRLGQP
jgi:dTDP-4-dehydrorhamnose reductase